MRARVLVPLILMGLGLGTGWYWLQRPPRPWPAFNRSMTAVTAPEASTTPLVPNPVPLEPAEPALEPADATTNRVVPSSNTASLLVLPAELPPQTALEQARIAVHLYAATFGENPVGLNFEITRALNGHNPRHVNFLLPEAGLRLNDQGELVDPWGTPYFFHQLSGMQMEIRSAGPDRLLWTPDDLVVR